MTMTYNGSTAGSTSANPPVLLAAGLGGHVNFATSGSTAAIAKLPTGASGAQLWFYSSTNVYTDMVALPGVFNDGYALGMRPGDVMIVVQSSADSTAPLVYIGALVTSAGSTAFGLSSGLMSSTMT